jgi:hypothetical protein
MTILFYMLMIAYFCALAMNMYSGKLDVINISPVSADLQGEDNIVNLTDKFMPYITFEP